MENNNETIVPLSMSDDKKSLANKVKENPMNTSIDEGSETAMRKRGRPRKYALGTSLLIDQPNFPSRRGTSLSITQPNSPPRQGRGRPRGTFRPEIPSFMEGERLGTFATGKDFQPYVACISAGEDMYTRMCSIPHTGSAIGCVLSASGTISSVTLRLPGSGPILTYEGRFEVLSMNGSFRLTGSSRVSARNSGVTVTFAGPDGRVIGGALAGPMVAASPTQVMMGMFKLIKRRQCRNRHNAESIATSVAPSTSGLAAEIVPFLGAAVKDETCATPTATLPEQGHGAGHNLIPNDTIATLKATSPEQGHREGQNLIPDLNPIITDGWDDSEAEPMPDQA